MRIEDCFPDSTDRKIVKAGETIFKEGEAGDRMFVVLKGIFDVFVAGNLVGSFEAVEIIGEMAVVDPGFRSATVIARTDCQLVPVNQKKFIMLTQNKPEFALHVMKVLVERMRWLNLAVENAQSSGATRDSNPDSSPAPSAGQ